MSYHNEPRRRQSKRPVRRRAAAADRPASPPAARRQHQRPARRQRRDGDRPADFEVVRRAFLQAEGVPFSEMLTSEQIHRAFAEVDALFGQEDDDRYTPELTLWGLLSQALHRGAERSCNAAVERIRSLCVALEIPAPSPDSGAYCRARVKLPEAGLQRLTYEVADALEAQVPKGWLWRGRHVKIADGSTLATPDTEDNQKAWPQASTQEAGLGFPILRFCALFSLATGALCGFAEAPYRGKETGETALLRTLFARLQAGDVLLGDACFCSYFMIALLVERGVDVVFHQHQRRTTDFTQGRSLGDEDHVVVWTKPECPDWMDAATYARMPDQLEVRELRQKVSLPGFRVTEVTVVTTLKHAQRYPKSALGGLYRERWQGELDLRSSKVTQGLEDLRGTFPAMVRKEIWAHWLAYNLIRKNMAAAAVMDDRRPRTISFAGALQTVAGVMGQASVAEPSELRRLAIQKLESIASHRVGNRPNRVEPRAIKRRPKSHKLLTKPRQEARAELGVSAASAV
jgi:putative transposase